jgi:GR25 family glycosyltransferase involved in LPS biosynthesis
VFTSDWDGPLDGQRIDQTSLNGFSVLPGWRIESSNPFWSRPLKKGELGCSISHWRCWKDAAERREEQALFFEDDVKLSESFSERLKWATSILNGRHPGWDLVYLGRSRPGFSFPLPPIFFRDAPVEEGLVRPGLSFGTFAYMLSRSGIAKVLSTEFEKNLIPADEFLPAMYIVHPRPDVARLYRPILNAYALTPPIAVHPPIQPTETDTEASDYVDWEG